MADLESITPGAEKPIFEAASRLIDRLGRFDAVGLLAIPGIELTREHVSVRDGIQNMRGSASPPPSKYSLSVREAEAFSLDDSRIISLVVERECSRGDVSCPVELRNLAMPLRFLPPRECPKRRRCKRLWNYIALTLPLSTA